MNSQILTHLSKTNQNNQILVENNKSSLLEELPLAEALLKLKLTYQTFCVYYYLNNGKKKPYSIRGKQDFAKKKGFCFWNQHPEIA